MSRKYYITTPIYYVNDKPHIGHAYTTVAADVLARWHRHRGDEVFFLTGTDEHGAKVAESAVEAGQEPQEFVNEVAKLFRIAWKNLNIKYDNFIRTTSPEHHRAVGVFINKLKASNSIYEDKYEGLYCVGCEKFITEKELVEGKCPVHNKKPKKIKEKNYFFKLTDYIEQVKELIVSGKMKILPEERKKEVLGLFEQGMEDFSVSREKVKWGIPLPFDKKQNIYVWVEALQNYISGIGYGEPSEKFSKWWPADCHIMAKDILKFHAIYWPALLLAVGEPLPKEQFIHGFFTIDGKKMSKSLGNVINPNDLVNQYGSDATRYLLLSQFPFGQDGDVKKSLFDEKYNSDLANGLGNLVSRTANLMEKNDVGIDTAQQPISNDKVDIINKQIEHYRFDEALKGIYGIISQANKYLDEQAPWKHTPDDKEKTTIVLQNVSDWIKTIAELIYPFMPITSRRISQQFAGPSVKKEDGLFPRLSDK
ncbi:methionine--tRNA ligase [Patescibacteria group bacterium]|nr:methionine--tRNA ligase [Patescibacteria group bacterium]MBU1889994.1 methionine--tRNA ligase [Patescibacteria group bacterium]